MKKNIKKNDKRIIDVFKSKINKMKKQFNRNNTKYTMNEVIIFMIIMFVFGAVIGGIISNLRGMSGSSKQLREFMSTYNEILNNYYEDVDSEELLQSGLEGMMEYLGDPYSNYLNKDETVAFNEEVEGKYVGIGAEITYDTVDNIFKITKVFDDTPSAKAGLLVDDIILKVDDQDISLKTITELSDLVKGKAGTSVKLLIKRSDKELTLNIKRASIPINSVETKVYNENDKKIGYMAISIFADNTDEQVKEKLVDLEKQDITRLIIDVRGNSGGYLTTATNIISLFTKKNTVIYQLKTKDKIEVIKDKTNDNRSYPIYVLVNSASASASEMLATALSENYGATIIGTTTFGKGKAQRTVTLSNGAMVKYTYQEWLTPNGNSIDEIGLEPNIKIDYVYEENVEIDNQLREAIKEISKE